jgi:hypothetical protein
MQTNFPPVGPAALTQTLLTGEASGQMAAAFDAQIIAQANRRSPGKGVAESSLTFQLRGTDLKKAQAVFAKANRNARPFNVLERPMIVGASEAFDMNSGTNVQNRTRGYTAAERGELNKFAVQIGHMILAGEITDKEAAYAMARKMDSINPN